MRRAIISRTAVQPYSKMDSKCSITRSVKRYICNIRVDDVFLAVSDGRRFPFSPKLRELVPNLAALFDEIFFFNRCTNSQCRQTTCLSHPRKIFPLRLMDQPCSWLWLEFQLPFKLKRFWKFHKKKAVSSKKGHSDDQEYVNMWCRYCRLGQVFRNIFSILLLFRVILLKADIF